jgi:type IV pilus assembly protein PilV
MMMNSISDAIRTSLHRAGRTSARQARNGRARSRFFTRSAQSGVGLIEVLVAVLVLSIGFLGIAALQAMSLSTNNSALARSMATINSYSILDSMRADAANARSGSYDGTVTADACPDAGTSLVGVQLNQWCKQLGQSLGAVATTKGTVACATGGTGACTITITFDDSRAGVGGTNNQTIVTRAML